MDIPGLVAIVAFAATDIDDLFLLMMFFSSRIYPTRQVVIGQLIGISALVCVSIASEKLVNIEDSNIMSEEDILSNNTIEKT